MAPAYLTLLPTYDYYWSFVDWHGEEHDGDFETKAAAQEKADDCYADYCEEERGFSEEDVDLIRFYYDEETGERVVVETVTGTVSYEYTRSDYEEHNTHWGL